MRTKFGILVAIFSLIGSGAAFAHHSFTTEYDGTKTFNIKGTVSKVEWTNPHARFYVDARRERQDGHLEHGAGESERAGAQRLDEPDAEGRRHGDRQGLRGESRAVPRRRAFGRSRPTGDRSSAARPTTTARRRRAGVRRTREVAGPRAWMPGDGTAILEGIVRQLFRKSQIPNPKSQIPRFGVGGCVLGLGIWVLGFGMFPHAQEGRGSLGPSARSARK